MTRTSLSRRRLLTGATAAAAGLALTGCVGRQPGDYAQVSGQVPARFARRRRVVLWSAFTSHNAEVLQTVIDGFNAAQQDIFCEIQLFPGYPALDSKLAASFALAQVPDLVTLSDVNWNRYFLAEALEPLNGYFDASFGPAAFHPRFLAEGTVRGQVYWLPWARSTPLFYYNKEIFAGAGLPDRGPKTFTELREWGRQLKGFTYRGSPVKMRGYTGKDDWYFQGSTWAFGGAYSDGMTPRLDSEQTVAALEFDRAFIHDDRMAYLSGDINADFAAGVTATICNSTGALSSLLKAATFEIGAAFLPEQDAPGVPTGGSGLAVMRNATKARKEATWEVVKYLITRGAPEWSLNTGYLPVTATSLASPEIRKRNAATPAYQVAQDQLSRARQPDVMRRYVNETVAEMVLALEAVYASGARPAEVLRETAQKLDPAIRRVLPKYRRLVS
ncbi:ABC transporter substrate-binding protein [Actinomadura sp. ATCC 31491]|uniref:ABC transporter substrate-binding protein n=1 Tax=Actinomadura luzonensis TaxID=2805427 RepID=A0ABT0FSP1_9ACTN|nr:ABC transporter substrate-binding protein [Actinomadura luzonensis]MCK2215345.1 ABC transporter substrate-binding protein [Actinomadura luzonensis]